MPGKLSRWERVQEYAISRLRAEVDAAPRGYQAKLCREMDVSSAHMSNMLSKSGVRGIGVDVAHKLAEHWGITYAQLELLASGEEQPPATSAQQTVADIETLRALLREEFPSLVQAEAKAKAGSGEHALGDIPTKKRPRKG